MGVQEAGESALSVIAVAAHSEKPGVQTPSRHKVEAGAEGVGNAKPSTTAV